MEFSILDESSCDQGCPLQDNIESVLLNYTENTVIPSLQVKRTPTQQIKWPQFNYLNNDMTPIFSQLTSFHSEYYSSNRLQDLQNVVSTPTRPVSRNHSNSQHYVSSQYLAEKPQDFFLIDCRWPYEYQAGTITGAVNIYTGEDLKRSLLCIERPISDKSILLFCEFSQCRSVRMSQFLVKVDRQYHGDFIYYNNVFILEGGFNQCFETQRWLITGGYIKEDDPNYTEQREYYSRNGTYKLTDGEQDDLLSPYNT